MDQEKKNYYVFGYGIALIIPFLCLFHRYKPLEGIARFLLLISFFILLLWMISQISVLKPVWNVWIILPPMGSGMLAFRESAWISLFLSCIALGVGILTIWQVRRIIPFYRLWMKGAGVIGHVVSTVIMTLIYAVIFVPVGMILRLLGKDFMDRKLEADAQSYWHIREKYENDVQNYYKQF